jgi:hypothetical protein
MYSVKGCKVVCSKFEALLFQNFYYFEKTDRILRFAVPNGRIINESQYLFWELLPEFVDLAVEDFRKGLRERIPELPELRPCEIVPFLYE